MVHGQTNTARARTWTFDPAGRLRTATFTPAGGSAATTANHYAGSGDSPNWIGEPDRTATRYLQGPAGDLAASVAGIVGGTTTTKWQVTNLHGEGVRRDKKVRTTVQADGIRAQDLLDRCFAAPAPNLVRVTDFTYCRTWTGFVHVAFIVDVFAQRIVAWHASTSKCTDLVMVPLRIELWQRDRGADLPLSCRR